MFNLNLYEAFNALDEIYLTDNQSDKFYHFYSDLTDLLHSLSTGRIYSNKNAQLSQLDIYASDNESYVCMTTGQEGKDRLVKHYNRPFGLSFKNLSELSDNRKYKFGTNSKYNQVAAKTQYSSAKRGAKRPTISKPLKNGENLANFRDFRILAIGKLADGRCFVSGGQGRNLSNHFHSKLFNYEGNEEFYKLLVNWFMSNMTNEKSQHGYFNFKNNYIGQPTETFEYDGIEYAINTDGQLNQSYIPWLDRANAKNGADSHTIAMAFSGPQLILDTSFEEIYGIGPFRVEDASGKVLLQMDMVKPGSKGGYQTPLIFGANDDTSEYSATASISDTGTTQAVLMLDADNANKLYDLFDENEYRVYIPNKRDFYFKAEDIATLVLPKYYKQPALSYISENKNVVLNIEALIRLIAKDGVYTVPKDKVEAIDKLKSEGILLNIKKHISDQLFDCISTLVDLLTHQYKDVGIELYKDDAVVTANNWPFIGYTNSHSHRSEADNIKKLSSDTKLRKVLNSTLPDMSTANISSTFGTGTPSVLADITLPSGENIRARIGAEVIVIGEDVDKNKYVLFVDNAHKAVNFLELPGGGLYKMPSDAALINDLKALAKHRLKFKGGLSDRDCTELVDTGKAVILDETDVAKNKKIE